MSLSDRINDTNAAPWVIEEINELEARLEATERERDFLIAEYERAVNCGPQGFAHAAGHLFNAIANARADTNTKHLLALRDERDALVAHLERLHRAFKATLVSGWSVPAEEALVEVFSDSPQASLARMKAQWQAEAVSTFAFHHLGGHEQEVAEIYASKLRRQAEGGET